VCKMGVTRQQVSQPNPKLVLGILWNSFLDNGGDLRFISLREKDVHKEVLYIITPP
jgi:hypothetical protein